MPSVHYHQFDKQKSVTRKSVFSSIGWHFNGGNRLYLKTLWERKKLLINTCLDTDIWQQQTHLSRITRKLTLWEVSTRISLSRLRRLTRIDTFRRLWIFCFRNHYSIPLSPREGMCRPGLACTDWTAQADLGRYITQAIMLVISWNSSFYESIVRLE